ncbi:MAG: hypothetical protein ACLFTT_10190 [Candidatus Hydrogenedentota bacterium]
MSDPVIEELWNIKDAIAKAHNYDVDALLDHLEEQGKHRKNELVDLAARKKLSKENKSRPEE